MDVVWADVMGVVAVGGNSKVTYCVCNSERESKDLGLCIVVLRNTGINMRSREEYGDLSTDVSMAKLFDIKPLASYP